MPNAVSENRDVGFAVAAIIGGNRNAGRYAEFGSVKSLRAAENVSHAGTVIGTQSADVRTVNVCAAGYL